MQQLRYSQQNIEEEDIAAVVRVLRSDYLTSGPEVERFEESLAEYVGARYCVAVSSGTAALHLAYLAAGKGRLNTSPLSFVATANAALLAGMVDVVFSDVDAATGNATLPGYHDCISAPVHFAGRAAPLPMNDMLAEVLTVEDACHALGAQDFDGCSRVGSCAHSLATCFSFHPVKPITTGEGGAITTNSAELAKQLYLLRSHGRAAVIRPDGSKVTELMVALGYNYRMTEMQAALGSSQLQRCDEMRERRCRLAQVYVLRLAEIPDFLGKHNPIKGVDWHGPNYWGVTLPEFGVKGCYHAHHLFPVRIKNGKRDAVKAALNEQGIMAQVHYSPPIHLQPYYRERFGYKEGAFPEAEAWAAEELSLPLHARMTEADVDRVCKALKEALE